MPFPPPPKQNGSLDENAGLLQSNEDFDQMSVSPPDKSVAKSRSVSLSFFLHLYLHVLGRSNH